MQQRGGEPRPVAQLLLHLPQRLAVYRSDGDEFRLRVAGDDALLRRRRHAVGREHLGAPLRVEEFARHEHRAGQQQLDRHRGLSGRQFRECRDRKRVSIQRELNGHLIA